MKPALLYSLGLLLVCPSLSFAQAGEKPNPKEAIKQIAGSAEFLRGVPKKYAALRHVDSAKQTVTLMIDGDKEPTTWPLTPDAEIKVQGWWGRLDELPPGEPRVWLWFKIDRAKKPVAIFMLADELSEQDIHGDGLTVKEISEKTITFATGKDKTRTAERSECTHLRGGKPASIDDLKVKDRVFVRRQLIAGRQQTEIMDSATFEGLRQAQKNRLRQRWLQEGLPGTIGFLHLYSGEVDVLLDHEAMRWGRSLVPGTKVELAAKPSIKGVVKSMQAQREKTQVRLVIRSFDLAELNTGQRVQLQMPAPSAAVENDHVPPDIDIAKTKEDRIDWFFANIYCTCGVGGDGCTGHFYTLASCNPNACGMPNATRQHLGKRIDEGWSNREIFAALLKQRGPTMLRPHLLP